MPTKINKDFQPSNRVYELLSNRFGLSIEMAREFVGHEILAFKIYWEETGKAKTSWTITCYNWMARNYEDKKEATARNRPASPPQGDIFEKLFNNMKENGDIVVDEVNVAKDGYPPNIMTRIRIPEPPDLGTMTTEDALAELRRITK